MSSGPGQFAALQLRSYWDYWSTCSRQFMCRAPSLSGCSAGREDEANRAAIDHAGIGDAVIQPVLDRPGEFLIRVPHQGSDESAAPENQAGVDTARAKVRQALDSFGPEAEASKSLADDPKAVYKIEGTDAVGQVASKQLRNQAIAV